VDADVAAEVEGVVVVVGDGEEVGGEDEDALDGLEREGEAGAEADVAGRPVLVEMPAGSGMSLRLRMSCLRTGPPVGGPSGERAMPSKPPLRAARTRLSRMVRR
jgi:hypothetical protein